MQVDGVKRANWKLPVLLVGMGLALFVYHLVLVRMEEEHILSLADKLQNKVIVIDSVNGGYPASESDLAAGVARRLVFLLGHSGAAVALTGDLDPSLDYPRTGAKEGFPALAGMAAEQGADLFVSIRYSPDGSFEIFYPGGSGEGLSAGEDIQRELAVIAGVRTGEPQSDAALGKERTSPACVLVEIGSPAKMPANYRTRIAWAVYAGAVRYFASAPCVVNGKILKTMEDDLPSTLNTP